MSEELNNRINQFGKSLSSARKNIIKSINNKGVICPTTEKLSILPEYIDRIDATNIITCKPILYPLTSGPYTDDNSLVYRALVGSVKTGIKLNGTNATDVNSYDPIQISESGAIRINVNWIKGGSWAGQFYTDTESAILAGYSKAGWVNIYIDNVLVKRIEPTSTATSEESATIRIKKDQKLLITSAQRQAEASGSRCTFAINVDLVVEKLGIIGVTHIAQAALPNVPGTYYVVGNSDGGYYEIKRDGILIIEGTHTRWANNNTEDLDIFINLDGKDLDIEFKNRDGEEANTNDDGWNRRFAETIPVVKGQKLIISCKLNGYGDGFAGGVFCGWGVSLLYLDDDED